MLFSAGTDNRERTGDPRLSSVAPGATVPTEATDIIAPPLPNWDQGVTQHMAVSLYRKYRPARFEDIVGQNHVARTLVNAIKNDRVSHAYLFAGPRGTGKTSTAKILAMALNCEAGKGKATATPDGTCARCESIRRGSSLDVVEMDAASNRGIDDIRELRDKVHFAPVEGPMKVYIVDEVHMLTPEAFNALLKTLEEPPVHAVFVLATTEPHKVPATILSRCQRFDFRRPSPAEVVKVLSAIASDEKIDAAESALFVIARAAGGSFRDAIGILDQLATYSGGKIALEETLEILGVVRHDLLFEMADYVRNKDAQAALLFVERLSQAGTDYTQFIKDLLGHLRDVYVVKHTAETPASIAASEEQLERLRDQATRCSTDQVVSFIDLLGEALRSIRQGSDPRLSLELVLIKMTTSDVYGKLHDLEVESSLSASPSLDPATAPPATNDVEAVTAVHRPSPSIRPTDPAAGSASPAELPLSAPARPTPPCAETPEGPPPQSVATVRADIEHLKRAWPVVLEAVKKRQASLSAVLGEGSPHSLEGDTLVVKFPVGYGFQANQVARGDNPKIIAEALREVTGKDLRIETKLASEGEPTPVAADEDARILSKDELIRVLKQEFDARLVDDDPHR
jgi:DNA polymerase-3 subunit gamma/tau